MVLTDLTMAAGVAHWGWLLWLDRIAAAITNEQAQAIRFWLAIANVCWLAPIGILAIIRPSVRFPNGGLAIPLTGIMLGLAGFSASAAWGFEPTPNWHTLLSLMIAGNLFVLLVMGVLRWRGYDL